MTSSIDTFCLSAHISLEKFFESSAAALFVEVIVPLFFAVALLAFQSVKIQNRASFLDLTHSVNQGKKRKRDKTRRKNDGYKLKTIVALQPKRRSLIWLHFLPKFSFTTPPPLPHTVFENGQNRLVLRIYEGKVWKIQNHFILKKSEKIAKIRNNGFINAI